MTQSRVYSSMLTGALQDQVFAPRPPAGFDLAADDDQLQSWVAATAEIAERNADSVAGIIVEPVLQGAGGMYAYSPHCLTALREIADRHNFALVFDEIATGFGRTGEMFASERGSFS